MKNDLGNRERSECGYRSYMRSSEILSDYFNTAKNKKDPSTKHGRCGRSRMMANLCQCHNLMDELWDVQRSYKQKITV